MSDAKAKRSGREAAPTIIEEASAATPAATAVTEPPAGEVAALMPPSPGTVEPVLPPVAESASAAAPVAAAAAAAEGAQDAWAAVAEMQAALAHGLEALATEITTVTRSDIAAATDAATAMLAARSFADTVEIAAGLMRRHADAVTEAGVRLSEIGFQAAAAMSRPFLARPPFA